MIIFLLTAFLSGCALKAVNPKNLASRYGRIASSGLSPAPTNIGKGKIKIEISDESLGMSGLSTGDYRIHIPGDVYGTQEQDVGAYSRNYNLELGILSNLDLGITYGKVENSVGGVNLRSADRWKYYLKWGIWSNKTNRVFLIGSFSTLDSYFHNWSNYDRDIKYITDSTWESGLGIRFSNLSKRDKWGFTPYAGLSCHFVSFKYKEDFEKRELIFLLKNDYGIQLRLGPIFARTGVVIFIGHSFLRDGGIYGNFGAYF